MRINRRLHVILMAALALASLAACSGDSTSGVLPMTKTLSGSVYAAPVDGASVTVMSPDGTVIAGPVLSSADGTYSINVPLTAMASDMVIEATGGTFTDEATGAMTTAGTLAAYIRAGALSNGSSASLDPSTTVLCDLVRTHGRTPQEAETLFSAAFGFVPDSSVMPFNGPTAGDDIPGRLAALRAMAFSRLTSDLGLSPTGQFDLIAAIAEDLSDGTLDSMNGMSAVRIDMLNDMPEDIQNRFEQALANMAADTTINLTGLTANQLGVPPFAKVALTASYRMEYIPGMMPPVQGKSSFRLRITNLSDGTPATGLAVALMPKMHMATMNHSTPTEPVIEDAGTPGTYKCTVYYLMAGGMSMGYWELKVTVGGMGGESATFFPQVGMAMGTLPARATLKGQSDLITGMMSPEKRTYYIFNTGFTNSSTFNFFIAAKESMMSYPAVSVGASLKDETGASWTVNTMDVAVSSDGTNWIAATDLTGGHWSVTGLTGLDDGTSAAIYVTIDINGEQKTADGNAVGADNGYATFAKTGDGPICH